MTLKVIPRLQSFSSAIRRTFVQYFTRFQLTACSRGHSATAGLLVPVVSKMVELKENDKWFRVSVMLLTLAQKFLATIWLFIEILRSLVLYTALWLMPNYTAW